MLCFCFYFTLSIAFVSWKLEVNDPVTGLNHNDFLLLDVVQKSFDFDFVLQNISVVINKTVPRNSSNVILKRNIVLFIQFAIVLKMETEKEVYGR